MFNSGLMCEVCSKAPARRGDIICSDRARAYTILTEIINEFPDLATDDFKRLKEVYEWRTHQQKPRLLT
jgi:hypothetical protein